MSEPLPGTDPRPEPPPPLDDDACCGNGCDPCVWDLHAAEVQRWREALRAWEARHGASATPATPT